jgi:hypothetical protein
MKQFKSTLAAVASAIIIFLIISVVYMYPVLEGKNLRQSDVTQFRGMSKELVDYREANDKEALWTNSQFGGMPGYLISTKYKSNLLKIIHQIFILNNWRPVCFIFLYLIGAFIAFLAFGVNKWLSIAGAIAYAFSSYFFVIIEVGHISKVLALGYLPPVVAGVHLAFQRKYLLGGIVMGLFLSLQLLVVHYQITYYTLIIVLFYGLFELIYSIREKKIKSFATAFLTLSIAAILAIASNFSNIWVSSEYGKYSIRGKSDLTHNAENQTSGLDKDYATQWSYGKWETFTMLIANFNGGSSASALPQKSKTYELLKKIQGASQARKTIKHMPTYWGSQISTSGPVYVGAVVIFLFVLGLFVVKNKKLKWWLISITILSILLSWGRNFPGLTNFFLDHVPGYNKFRTVAMTLVIAEFSIPLLGILAVNEILKGDLEKNLLQKYILRSFYIVGGICLFFILFAGSLFDFQGEMDQQYLQQGATDFINAVRADRHMLLRRDAFRSLVFAALGALILYFYVLDKLKTTYLISGLGLLILVDMWGVNKRYLSSDNFVSKKEYNNPITKTKADEFILRDKDLSYRVLNLSVSPFQDATTSYYHKSIGGYHGAKIRRYQELFDFQIIPELQMLIGALQQGSMVMADSVLTQCNALNMLNTRYFIYNPDAMPLINNSALGNAWFVSSVIWVDNADDELARVGDMDPAREAVIDSEFTDELAGFSEIPIQKESSIKLISYAPNKLTYESSSETSRLAVFSEIYYPKGWHVTIDDQPATHFRADYLLRAMLIPAGNHTIDFEFHPASYYIGEKISLAGSSLLLLILLGVIIIEIRKLNKVND